MTSLSLHFSLEEFTASQVASRLGREIVPTDEQIANARALCVLILEPLRNLLARPVVISSGIRPEWLNKSIGGAYGSAHMTGRAADFKVIGMSAAAVCRFVKKHANALPVDKCIEEFGAWTHIQIATGTDRPRQQYLTARTVGGVTVYQVLE